jgi:hypothetical protein
MRNACRRTAYRHDGGNNEENEEEKQREMRRRTERSWVYVGECGLFWAAEWVCRV